MMFKTFAVCVTVLLSARVAAAQLSNFDVRRVAHSTQALPGVPAGMGFQSVVIDQGIVGFLAEGLFPNTVVFRHEAGVTTRIAGTGDLIPGTGIPFRLVGRPSLSNGRFSFAGSSETAFQRRGVYAWQNGQRSTLFNGVAALEVHSGQGRSAYSDGSIINYQDAGGGVRTAVDNHTVVPRTSEVFGHLQYFSFNGERVLFTGGTSSAGPTAGLYISEDSSAITRIADRTTMIPGENRTFEVFQFPQLTESHAFFRNVWNVNGSNQSGVFGSAGTGLMRLIDNSMTVPGTNVSLRNAGERGFAASDDDLLFTVGTYIPGMGYPHLVLCRDFGESIELVASVGQTLDGRTIRGLQVYDGGYSGDEFVFRATFTDGTSGVYHAVIPAAGTLPAMMGLAWMCGGRRRRAVGQ